VRPSLHDPVRLVTRELLDALHPELCRLCGGPAEPGSLVGTCARHALPDPTRAPAAPTCELCARRLPPMLPDGERCAACRRRRPRFRRLRVLGDYRADEGLREWVLALKHGGRRDLAVPLGRALAARLLREHAHARRALLVPVPLHPLRRLERGFDQAGELARAVAEALGAPVRSLLRRTRWTPVQGALGAVSRRANVTGAFEPLPGARAELTGIPVWLVDDVVTSGATVEACAAALGGLGARGVSVLAAARAGADARDS